MSKPRSPRLAAGDRASCLSGRMPWALAEKPFRSLHGALTAPTEEIKALGAMGADPASLFGEADDPTPALLTVEGGVAKIAVRGVMFQHASWWDRYLGTSSYEAIGEALAFAVASADVSSIVLVVDSPGGQATGCGELAAEIRAAAGRKPTMAFVPGQACSAAYYLASATREIVVAPSAVLGSIGTIVVLYDDSKFMESLGIKEIPVVSSVSPNKYPDIATDEGIALYQELVDSMAALFVADVAKYRGVSASTVKKDFGAGWVRLGADAVASGLADRVGTLGDVVGDLAGGYRPRAKGGTKPRNEGRNMSWSLFKKAVLAMPDDDEATPNATAPAAATPAPAPAPSNAAAHAPDVSAELERVRAENAQLRSEREAERKAEATRVREEADRRIDADATAFATAEVKAGRVTPDRLDAVAKAYAVAARDDRDRPVEGFSRLDSFKAAQSSAPPAHGMTEDVVAGTKLTTLPGDSSEDDELVKQEESTRKYAKQQNGGAARR